jgi:autotransporter adhesin
MYAFSRSGGISKPRAPRAQLFAGAAVAALMFGVATTPAAAVAVGNGNASGVTSIAISDPAGLPAKAATVDSIAIGEDATVGGTIGYGIAIGDDTSASDYGTAVGSFSVASGRASAAYGGATASGLAASAFGASAFAGGDDSGAFGEESNASGIGAYAFGFQSVASGDESFAAGTGALATGQAASAFGNGAGASAQGALALGAFSIGSGRYSTASGTYSASFGDYSVASGTFSQALALESVAIGGGPSQPGFLAGALAQGIASVALGASSETSGELGTAIGSSSTADGNFATAVGSQSNASGLAGAALGYQAQATGALSIAAGNQAAATQDQTSAFGNGATASALGATALGSDASATGLNAVAIGSNSVAGVANTVSFGSAGNERLLVNVAAGGLSANSTDAVNGSQLYATNQNVALALANSANALNINANGVAYDDGTHSAVTLNSGGAAAALHNVADGTVAAGGTDAVNGGQLFVVSQTATAAQGTANTALALGQNSVQYDNGGHTSATLNAGGGAAGLHNVAAGAVAANSVDAVNGGQLYATNQNVLAVQGTANSALALGQNALQYDNAGHTSATLNPGGAATSLHNVAAGVAPTDAVNVGQLAGIGAGLRSDVFSGIAASTAITSAPTPSGPGKTTLALSSGFFENYTGVGLSFAHRFNTDVPLSIEGGFAHAGGENVGRVGFSVEF